MRSTQQAVGGNDVWIGSSWWLPFAPRYIIGSQVVNAWRSIIWPRKYRRWRYYQLSKKFSGQRHCDRSVASNGWQWGRNQRLLMVALRVDKKGTKSKVDSIIILYFQDFDNISCGFTTVHLCCSSVGTFCTYVQQASEISLESPHQCEQFWTLLASWNCLIGEL